MQPSHNVIEDLLAGLGFTAFSVGNLALHKHQPLRYRMLVWITSILCLVRAGMSFSEAWNLYHDGKPLAVPVLYLAGALIVLFLSIQVFASSGSIIAKLKARRTEQVSEQTILTMNADSLAKSSRLVTQQQGGH